MRIAIVNDLALAREVLRRVVTSLPGYSVAWAAEDGDDAVRKVSADRPDAVLMDLVMPKMNGVEATRRVMQQTPCAVLIVTSSVSNNFDLVYQAMGAGALDAVDTPTLGPSGTVLNSEKLIARLSKLRSALAGTSCSSSILHASRTSGIGTGSDMPPIVAIGASTGGPEALSTVLGALPGDFPATVLVAQHIDAEFAVGLVQQLAARCKLPVRAARDGDSPVAGTVYVAVSNDHLEVAADRKLRYTAVPRSYPYRPSVDVLFSSACAHAPRLGIGVLLTGMGADGAEGMLRMRGLGWHTIAQNEASCVVYGMPKAAVERRAAVETLPLDAIGSAIVAKLLNSTRR